MIALKKLSKYDRGMAKIFNNTLTTDNKLFIVINQQEKASGPGAM